MTIGKRATLWMQDLMSDLEELDFVIGSMKFLGCRGTTGTEASFLDLFDGDTAKIDEMNRMISATSASTSASPSAARPIPGSWTAAF